MSLGLPRDAASINAKAGALIVQLREDLRQCAAFNALLNDADIFTDNTAIQNTGFANAGEVTALKAAFADLSALNAVANGLQATGASNFFANAKKLTGVVV